MIAVDTNILASSSMMTGFVTFDKKFSNKAKALKISLPIDLLKPQG